MPRIAGINKNDIGGEILPIITRGLYRDPLDAIREYIQNAIDAKAKEVDLHLSRDIVVVSDDGVGMTETIARDAIRLGLSEKDSTHDIGFRGIGIYSSFELCDELEIYTKHSESSLGFILRFDFSGMRKRLAEDEERKKKGEEKIYYLEKLLRETVTATENKSEATDAHGTKVFIKGIRS